MNFQQWSQYQNLFRIHKEYGVNQGLSMIMLGKESENKLLSDADVRSAEMQQIGLLATDDHWLVCLHLLNCNYRR